MEGTYASGGRENPSQTSYPLGIKPGARNALADRCQDPESGVRNVDQMIDQSILPKISLALLEQMAEDQIASRLILDADDNGEFTFEFDQD